MLPSMADGATFLPPAVTIKSFFRPVILRKPSLSISPRSPVCCHPSAVSGLGGFGGHLVVLAHDVAPAVEDLSILFGHLFDTGAGRADPAEPVVPVAVDIGERSVFGHADAFQNQHPGGVEEPADLGVDRCGA